MADREFAGDVIEELLEKLADGESLTSICDDNPRMPSRRTVARWALADDQLARRILEAREVGFFARAERAVEEAKTAEDPIAGRLAFDAERWFLGKLSNAFRDKPLVGVAISVGGDDAFAAVQGALDRAAATLAGSGHATRAVALAGEAGPGDAAGRLADLGSAGGEGLGQDADRG